MLIRNTPEAIVMIKQSLIYSFDQIKKNTHQSISLDSISNRQCDITIIPSTQRDHLVYPSRQISNDETNRDQKVHSSNTMFRYTSTVVSLLPSRDLTQRCVTWFHDIHSFSIPADRAPHPRHHTAKMENLPLSSYYRFSSCPTLLYLDFKRERSLNKTIRPGESR